MNRAKLQDLRELLADAIALIDAEIEDSRPDQPLAPWTLMPVDEPKPQPAKRTRKASDAQQARRAWTTEDKQFVLTAHQRGISLDVIAGMMGRTVPGIRGLLHDRRYNGICDNLDCYPKGI